jgi:eukaryotic-like serine/threonine-protein kinase
VGTIHPSRARLGAFELDLRAGELCGAEGKVTLQQQPFQLLLMLLERRGEVATREEIRKKLWPNDTVVEFDHAINTAIKKLRQALGDSAENPKYIETVARRGYRMLVPVEWAEPASSPGGVGPGLVRALQIETAAEVGAFVAKPIGAANLLAKKVSHYRVLEMLGGGGMGVVYKAEDIKLSRLVALKFLPEELASDPAALERFEREARAASALEHPNICPVYEFGEHEGQPFIAMQLLSGQTLRERIATEVRPRSALKVDELLDLAIQIADGLDAAHSKGIIHRDIKPANIFITTRGEAKILDFGLAKLVDVGEELARIPPVRASQEGRSQQKSPAAAFSDPHLTRTGTAMGTASYMSPEQVRGEKVDARTDLFSFGLVLYEMATGQQAFKGETTAVVRNAILSLAPAPPRELNPEVPPRLEETINKAIENDRGLRYQHAADMRADLKRLKRDTDSGRSSVGATLPLTPSPSPAGRGWSHGAGPSEGIRQRPLALAATVLVLVVGAVTAWFLTRHPHGQTQRDERQVTANPPEDWVLGAAVSPDGKHIAYNDQTGLYIRSIDSGETHAVSLPEGFQNRIWGVEWFPDGGKLLAEAWTPQGPDLWVITIMGDAAPHLLYRHALFPAISLDGQSIAFVGYNLETGEVRQDVWVGGIGGESPRKLATGEPRSLASPAWSPDGHWIAYVERKKSAQGSWSSAIQVRPAGGGTEKTLISESSLPKSSSFCYLTSIPAPCLTWSWDWRLLFSAAQAADSPSGQPKYGLWNIPVEPPTGEAAGKPEPLALWSDFGPQDLTISGDGKRLSFLKTRVWQDVYLCELGPGGGALKVPRRFTLDNRGIESLDNWTLDSQAILFSADRNGKTMVFRQGLNENVGEAVVQGPEDNYDGALSPDGSWMLYVESTREKPGAPASPQRLMRRPAAGGSADIVLEQPFGITWGYSCPTMPRSQCVLGQHEGQDFVFYSLDPVRSRGQQLGKIEDPLPRPRNIFHWEVSPDGSRAALVELEYKGKIEVLTFRDRTSHEVPVEAGWGDLQSVAWAADGKGFFVTSWLPDSFNLLHVALDGKVNPLLRNGHRQWMWGPLPSPDGKYLAFQAQTTDSNVWMLEGF